MAHYLIFTRRGDDEYKADKEVVPKDGDMKVKKAVKGGKNKEESLVEEEQAPEPLMHIEDPLSAEKQEAVTLKADDEEAPVKPISTKVEVVNVVPKLEVHGNIVEAGVPTSLVAPKLVTVKFEKPVKIEKVSEVQATLLSAGFRSRRALSTTPETRRATKPEFGMPVFLLDSDSEEGEDSDDSDFTRNLAEGVTIAQRLRRRRVS